MRKIISLLLLSSCAQLYSVSASASRCDGSTISILNLNGQKMVVSNIVSDGRTTISSVNLEEPRKNFNFTVQSGSGSQGDASGQITLSYVDDPVKVIVLNYKFVRHIEFFRADIYCHPALTVSGLPSSAYHILSHESGKKDNTQITLFLYD